MGATTLKVSDETLKAFGATAADFEEKVIAALAKNKSLTETNEGFAAFVNEAKEKFAAIDTRFSNLPKPEPFKLSTEDRGSLVADLKVEAAREVSAALAKAGTGAVGTGKTEDTSGNGDQKAAADDYEAQWKANENIRAEFIDFDSYKAFAKAQAEGRVSVAKIQSKK